ncbi:MAG: hypothetical protein WC819_01105 [Parcubacteria group bacterium]|jgi:Tol biopolymer transport system component
MKKRQYIYPLAVISLTVLCGCAITTSPTQKDKNDVTNDLTDREKMDDTTAYKKLYDPPEGGDQKNIGKIIFASDLGSTTNADYDLYTINPDGTEKTRLTTVEGFIDHPAWSPEHSRIAYSAHVDEYNTEKIFIMTVDGSEKRQLTFGKSRDKFPTWSPDGKYIAYIAYTDNTPNLFVLDIYGENQKQLTFVDKGETALWPTWSPDGSVIGYSYNKAGDEIDFRLRTIRPDGTDMREIISSNDPDVSDHEPAWSPDGKTLYFLSNRSSQMEIWKMDYDKYLQLITTHEEIDDKNVNLTQVSHLASVNVNPDHRPRVSPDGKKIVFYGVGSDWHNIGTNLYIINVDGTGLTNITKSIDGNEWPNW